MRLARIASFVHKWLALLIGVQIVFWVVSGLFFTLYPIEQIRSEHLIRPATPQTLDAARFASFTGIADANGRAPMKLTMERRAGRQVILAEFADGAPVLFDAATLERLSPLTPERAREIAQAHVTLTTAPSGVDRVTEESAEYRGALPAYRVRFADGGLSVYVAENTGLVTARRSDLWRLYDTLWALHIMDWRDHEDFNHPLIVTVAWLTLFSVIAGVILIPYRIKFGRNGRSKPAA